MGSESESEGYISISEPNTEHNFMEYKIVYTRDPEYQKHNPSLSMREDSYEEGEENTNNQPISEKEEIEIETENPLSGEPLHESHNIYTKPLEINNSNNNNINNNNLGEKYPEIQIQEKPKQKKKKKQYYSKKRKRKRRRNPLLTDIEIGPLSTLSDQESEEEEEERYHQPWNRNQLKRPRSRPRSRPRYKKRKIQRKKPSTIAATLPGNVPTSIVLSPEITLTIDPQHPDVRLANMNNQYGEEALELKTQQVLRAIELLKHKAVTFIYLLRGNTMQHFPVDITNITGNPYNATPTTINSNDKATNWQLLVNLAKSGHLTSETVKGLEVFLRHVNTRTHRHHFWLNLLVNSNVLILPAPEFAAISNTYADIVMRNTRTFDKNVTAMDLMTSPGVVSTRFAETCAEKLQISMHKSGKRYNTTKYLLKDLIATYNKRIKWFSNVTLNENNIAIKPGETTPETNIQPGVVLENQQQTVNNRRRGRGRGRGGRGRGRRGRGRRTGRGRQATVENQPQPRRSSRLRGGRTTRAGFFSGMVNSQLGNNNIKSPSTVEQLNLMMVS